MKSFKILQTLRLILLTSLSFYGQDLRQKGDSLQDKGKRNKMAIGFNLNQYQSDFGLGLNITTPYIAHSIAFRLQGNYQWLQNIPRGDTSSIWSGYQNLRLGIVTRAFAISRKLSIYSEGGVLMLLANNKVSSAQVLWGGYGIFGVEFHPTAHWGQFFEAGGVGTGAVADKSIGRPIYSNGFIISTGFRVYF